MRRLSLITLIFLLLAAGEGFAQQSSQADFEEWLDAREGRWVGEITWITDWPGLGSRGDQTTAYAEMSTEADGRAQVGLFYGGNGTSRWVTVFDAASGEIRETGGDSGGTTWDCVISKQGRQWGASCTGSLGDGTRTESETTMTISDGGNTHTWTGRITIGGEDVDPLNDVWRRVGG